MKKSIFFILGVLSVLFIAAQNTSNADKTKGQKNLNLPKLIPQIPNPSFEDTLCCPTSFSEMSCCDFWVQATDATPDYLNSCGFMPSITPLPLPDGNGCVGEIFNEGWKEYVGMCLPQYLDSGINYNFTIDISFLFTTTTLDSITHPLDSISLVNITLFGDTECPFSPYPVGTSDCPVGIGGWQALGYVTVNPYDIQGVWATYNINFTPNANIKAIMFGPPCTLPSDSLYQFQNNTYLPYFFFDNITSSYNSVSVNPSNSKSLTIYPNPGNGKFTIDYKIDKNEDAILSVFSLSGQLMVEDDISGNSNHKTIDLTQFSNGIYFVKVQTKTTVWTKKIVISK